MSLLYRYFTILLLSLSFSNASFLDNYYLSKAYDSYEKKEYNSTLLYLKKIENISIESQTILGDSYYKKEEYQKAIECYQSIQSTSVKIKQHLYYNIANAYVKLFQYDQAKVYYAKVLQLGADGDATYNLALIALLENRKEGDLGIAHPKSQNSSSTKSEKKSSKESKRDEDKPSSGSSGDGESAKKENQKKGKLMSNHKEEKHPLGSKVYELINEGYIYEKKPW